MKVGSRAGDCTVPRTRRLKSLVSYEPKYPEGRAWRIAPSELANRSAVLVEGSWYPETRALPTVSSRLPPHLRVTRPDETPAGGLAGGGGARPRPLSSLHPAR